MAKRMRDYTGQGVPGGTYVDGTVMSPAALKRLRKMADKAGLHGTLRVAVYKNGKLEQFHTVYASDASLRRKANKKRRKLKRRSVPLKKLKKT